MEAKRVNAKSIIRILLTALGIEILGIGFGILGALLAIRAWKTGTLADLGLGIMGLAVGYMFGIFVGIICNKYLLLQKGSLIGGIAVAVLWAVFSLVIGWAVNFNHVLISIWLYVSVIIMPFAAIFGFYFRRR